MCPGAQPSSNSKSGQRGQTSKPKSLVHIPTENELITQFLCSLPEFSCLPASEVGALSGLCRTASLTSGEYITVEGDDASTHGFIVMSGRLAMLKTSASGKDLIVELLQKGDIFGLLLMLAAERLPEQLSARALQATQILWVPFIGFTHLLSGHPLLFKNFVAHLLLCLQSSYKLSRGLAHDRVEVRIAAVLASLAIKFLREMKGDEGVTINFTRQQLADLTGTTPETAIRVTRAMQHDGLIQIVRPGIIRIVDRAKLLELAEE